jgi:hypothetical protein
VVIVVLMVVVGPAGRPDHEHNTTITTIRRSTSGHQPHPNLGTFLLDLFGLTGGYSLFRAFSSVIPCLAWDSNSLQTLYLVCSHLFCTPDILTAFTVSDKHLLPTFFQNSVKGAASVVSLRSYNDSLVHWL